MSVWRRPGLVPGIYDEIVTARVQRDLDALPASLAPDVQPVPEKADLVTPVAALVREALDAALDDLGGARDETLALADEVFAVLGRHAPRILPDAQEWRLSPSRLHAIVERPATEYGRPKGSLHRSSLRSEFDSASDRTLVQRQRIPLIRRILFAARHESCQPRMRLDFLQELRDGGR